MCFLSVLLGIISFLFIHNNLSLLSKALPLVTGAIYYVYAHFFIFGDETDKSYLSPLIALLSVFFLVMMFFSGANDSGDKELSKNLNVVIFDEQKFYPNKETDWRLLENLGDKLILINLKRYKENKNYFIKVVEIEKVDEIL